MKDYNNTFIMNVAVLNYSVNYQKDISRRTKDNLSNWLVFVAFKVEK